MALSDRNIVITPNKSKSDDPKIVFSGANAAVSAQNVTLRVYPDNAGTLSFEGSAGQLFSITNSLSGTIFSVNDVSGIPSISVDSSGIVLLAPFGGKVGIGTSSSFGLTSNVFSVYGTTMAYGNIKLTNPTGGTSGIYFNDGTYLSSATSYSSYGNPGTIQIAGAGNTFNGDSSTFFWDNTNKRLGIGTPTPSNTLTVVGTTPGWFNTTNGANVIELVVGNTTATSTTVGYAAAASVPYGYITATASATRNITFNSLGYIGIGGVTLPKNTLDVGGSVVIGATYAGSAIYTAPSNGLAVQGSVGVGTSGPASTLDVNGWAGFRQGLSAASTVTVASLTSNGAVSGTTGTFTGALYGASFNTAGTATVASLVSNGTISTATADTATAASHYYVETASDGVIRPKTLANARTEIVTTAAVNAAAATTVGTVTSGIWNAGAVTSATFTTSIADTATAASHYYVETASDGVIRPKTLANARTEIVTTAAVNAAAATTVGTVTSGVWNAGAVTSSGQIKSTNGAGAAILDPSGDIYAYRSGGTTGVIFLNNTGTRYLYFDGTSYQMPSSGLTLGGAMNATSFTTSADTLNRFAQGAAVLRGGSPTMYFRDTDQMSAMLHCNSNLLYVLRGAIDSETWAQVGGQWPAIFDLSNNNATFGAALSAVGEVTAYSSDRRLKENIKNIPDPLAKIQQLNGVTFTWKDKTEEIGFTVVNKDDVGVIAQEVQKVLPEAVRFAPFDRDEKGNSRSGEDYLTVQYEKLTALLIEAVKDQQKMIDDLKNRISILESQLGK